jgi:hypothetical protein
MGGRGVLVVGAAVLVLGCGSSSNSGIKSGPEKSSQNGVGGQGGASVADASASGSQTGAAGSSGGLAGAGGAAPDPGFTGDPPGEMPDCSVLETQYANTIAGAQSCDLNGSGQCQQLVDATLSACPSCKTYVNDAAIVNTIKTFWMSYGCASQAPSSCPPLSCPTPAGATCKSSSAGGTCTAN